MVVPCNEVETFVERGISKEINVSALSLELENPNKQPSIDVREERGSVSLELSGET